jgi:uncharacterized protein (TIGR02147 family)
VQTAAERDVFGYRDYRRFLADSYQVRKNSEYGFSYRSFARRIGSAAPNYLKLVMDGQRNLTPEMAARFASALGLQGDSADYFCDLVAFNQAASALERDRSYQRLTRHRRYKKAFRLDAAHAEYHSEWYIPAIRELVGCAGFREDTKWIARKLKPSISTRQAEHALKVLLRLGLIVRGADGTLEHQEPVLTTGDDQPLGHHITTFHRTMLERAAESLDTCEREEREVAGLTLSLSEAQFRELKRTLYRFRQELLQAAVDGAETETPTRVVQVNFQMFPLTELVSGSDES